MKKQISLKIEESCVIAYMNELELFRISNDDKTIKINDLYKKMAISKDDTLENLIEEIDSENKSSIEILYENTKTFLDELIKKIKDVLTEFDVEKEEENLLNQ